MADIATRKLCKKIALWSLVPFFALVLVVSFIFWHKTVEKDTYVVSGRSMEETFHNGDKVKVSHGPNQRITVGDIVVFSEPDGWESKNQGKTIIKRLLGLPGDTVRVVSTNSVNAGVYVNDKKIREFPNGYSCNNSDTVVLDSESYMVAGDNPLHSTDSIKLMCDGNHDAIVHKSNVLSFGNATIQ